ncbi:polyhomeotic 1 [Solea senegalensis]|uniref:Polyhomeotic 1 n=1 Tax=Solea senegalensis TaxID=28829 RepID=A0AAV6PQ54_SOLSE|nr:polyhomeotic-like protein 1 [Solea senegalensis]KAG7474851.1 polyhomeotic 1 [Solea senegalensis]
MDGGEDQNISTTTNGNPQTSGNSRTPQIAHMSLYERQAVQALQALQRQPNAAQYFQQLMLQQQINNAQLHNLAAVQQATLAASRQSNTPNNSMSQATTTVNLSATSAVGTVTNTRPHGPVTSTTTPALNQSVLLGGNSAGQGQMYLRVNRSLRAPLASQLIFMPGGTATATVTTVAQTQPQQPQQQQQQQHDVAPTSAQSDNDQVQNLALHCVSTPRAVSVKSEHPERKDGSSFPLGQQQQTFSQTAQQQQVQPQQQQQMVKPNFTQQSSTNTLTVKAGNQAMTVTPAASVAPSSTSSAALPLSQLLLSSSAAPVILVPTSNVSTSTQGYPIGSVTQKANMNTQTLVVQPLQQASTTADKGPVPIQPKMAQGHRLPLQLPPRHPPPILPAPPSNSQAITGGHNPPHIPVQLVGARQGLAGNAQAVALAQARGTTAQESSAAGNVITASNNNVMTKPVVGSLKRKSDCDVPNDMVTESSESATVKDSAPPLSPAPTKDSAPPVTAAFSSPPTLSLPAPLPRVGHGDKDRAPVPQAVVKPQVLTHLIEGFVIQEGAEPFPVVGLLKDRDFALVGRSENGPPLLKCEYCGSLAPASQFRGSKRFCSNTCAKRYNVSCSQHFKTSRGRSGAGMTPPQSSSESAAKRRGPSRRNSSNISSNKMSSRHLPVKCHSESSRSEDMSSDEEEEEDDSPSLSPSSSRSCSRAEHGAPRSDSSAPGSLPIEGANFLSATPAQWSVEEVYRFISSLQGCEELAAQFLSQEIDGQALLLLREDHLISTMNIKLGPALKICASINSLRE